MANADLKGAMAHFEACLEKGWDKRTYLSLVLDPALATLGQLWEEGKVSISQSYVAARIAETILLHCLPKDGTPREGDLKGKIIIGNIEDDFHSLGRKILGSFLRAQGWEVYDLGNDVPPEDFLAKAEEVQASLLGVSAMMLTTALNIIRLRELMDKRGLASRMRLAVGGAVFTFRPDLVELVGAHGTAKNAALGDALMQRLAAELGEKRR
jgi:methanogenic corrinoid protein MtbC1